MPLWALLYYLQYEVRVYSVLECGSLTCFCTRRLNSVNTPDIPSGSGVASQSGSKLAVRKSLLFFSFWFISLLVGAAMYRLW